ncbi:serine hydrolase domain-containing protein [Peristeroidobacter soli]|uniref:serine hydrolase domain-containing protein n=1 Tax=Peristeroidobacter soli TaxID=2497877 RepID=UPI0013006469|nr:serine hydrolase [Peristeroidobacter soli]
MQNFSASRLLLTSSILLLAACGSDDNSPSEPSVPAAFVEVDNAARAAYTTHQVPMGLAVYDREGTKVFERMYGDFSADRRVPIASASKLVSGVTIFRLIDAGYLSLDSTTGELLGWTGTKGEITLRHLLSFTSGLEPEHACTYQPDIALVDCVEQIRQRDLLGAPGSRFDYGSTHLHVAGLMAEVAVGSDWNDIFAEQLHKPLQLAPEFAYYAAPRQGRDTRPTNPLLAGGMRASMNDYERVLHFVFDKGRWQGSQLLAASIFDTQSIEPYPNAVIGTSPRSEARYGLTAWLECPTPATGCTSISSPGVFGFTPWLDRTAGYYAILGMQLDDLRSDRGLGTEIERTLKPLIEDAIARQ